MDIRVYHTLHKDAVKIRKDVFMEEQGFHDEFDETDQRGKHLGSHILSAAESKIRNSGGTTVRLHAQQQAKHFYEKQGYTVFGEPDFDEDCPHIWMEKELEKIL